MGCPTASQECCGNWLCQGTISNPPVSTFFRARLSPLRWSHFGTVSSGAVLCRALSMESRRRPVAQKSAEIPIDNLAICDSIGFMVANRTRRPLDVVCQSAPGRRCATASRHTNRDLRKIVPGCLNGVTPSLIGVTPWKSRRYPVEISALPRGNFGVRPALKPERASLYPIESAVLILPKFSFFLP